MHTPRLTPTKTGIGQTDGAGIRVDVGFGLDGGADDRQTAPLGPWNPGISSTLPRRLYPLVTIYSEQNAAVDVALTEELAQFSGLPMPLISELEPERLVLHELLVRVMTELTIDDGPAQSDLGANFRNIISALLANHLAPAMPTLRLEHAQAKRGLEEIIRNEIAMLAAHRLRAPTSPSARRFDWWSSWRGKVAPVAEAGSAYRDGSETATLAAIERWRRLADEASSPLARAAHRALRRAAAAVAATQGSIVGHGPVIERLAIAIATNDYGSRRLGALIEPLFLAAIDTEGYRPLPTQPRPIVMNTKGASAAGKSTLRPKQRALAERIGANWSDFAIISPDIWRKQLLDYDSLGQDRRWAGTLTAYEVEIIDRKLDRHIAARAEAGLLTHMLIDRFRFDSFAPEGAEDDATQLLTRFGSEVYLFFMITPPEETVERAWTRGERVGRYKAVDDLLAHNIEAYTGMPALFFRWAASKGRDVYYEFLDNSVAEGDSPRTIAFGHNDEMIIVDLDKLVDIDRYTRIDIAARAPAEVYRDAGALPPADDLRFLRACVERIPKIVLAEHDTGDVYGKIESGAMLWLRRQILSRAVSNAAARAYLGGLAGSAGLRPENETAGPMAVDHNAHRTLGAWGRGSGP